MEVPTRPKRVTGPLCSAVRARLTGESTGYSCSSGSEHEAATCLSRLVQAFLEIDNDESDDRNCSREECDGGDESGSSGHADCAALIKELLDPAAENDLFRIRLASAVRSATEAEKMLRWEKPGLFRRAMMGRLRNLGFDAGICKSKWETAGGLTGGSHEYIDVMFNQTR
jgi:PDDEXK-like family of unknown function